MPTTKITLKLFPCESCNRQAPKPQLYKCAICQKGCCADCALRSIKYGAICPGCSKKLTPGQAQVMQKEKDKFFKLQIAGCIISLASFLGFIPIGMLLNSRGSAGPDLFVASFVGLGAFFVVIILGIILATRASSFVAKKPKPLPNL